MCASEEAQARREILGCELRLLLDGGPSAHRGREDPRPGGHARRRDASEYEPAAVLTHSNADFHNDHLLIYNACLPTQRLALLRLLLLPPHQLPSGSDAVPSDAPTSTSPTRIDANDTQIAAHASQSRRPRLDTEMDREHAHMQGRWWGLPYCRGAGCEPDAAVVEIRQQLQSVSRRHLASAVCSPDVQDQSQRMQRCWRPGDPELVLVPNLLSAVMIDLAQRSFPKTTRLSRTRSCHRRGRKPWLPLGR